MPNNIQLLKQVRNAAAIVNQTTDNPEFKALLTSADTIFNELILQDSPAFYLDHVSRGKALLTEGNSLAAKTGKQPAEPMSLRSDLNAELRIEVIEAEIERLYEYLLVVVDVLDEGRSAAEKDFLVRVCDWENSLYNHRLEQGAGLPDASAKTFTPAALQAYLEKKFPDWKNLKITSFVTLDGGFSKKTILFETDDAVNGHQSLVMRAEQPVNLCCYEGSDVTQEFYMIQLMRKHGLPIAEPMWLEADPSQLGMRFIVSRKAIGKTYGGNMGSNEVVPAELLQSIMSTFIQLHNIKPDPADPLVQKSHLNEWMPYKTVSDATRYCVTDFMRRLIRLTGIQMTPQLLRGLKWLEKNVPEVDEAPAILHIDFAFNNLIIDQNHITAVLDWESSRLGDPAEDIIWTQQSLGPYISMPEFMKQYREGTGRDISEYRIAYCKVAKCALNAITCLSALRAIGKDDAAHINLGILGLKYMALFGAQFNTLIDEAEKARDSMQ